MKLRIGQKVVLLVLLSSAMAILLLSGLSLYGMLGVRQTAVDTGGQLGARAAADSNAALEAQVKEKLALLAQEKARYTESKLKVIRDNVSILSAQMTRIASNPGDYPARAVPPPRREDAGVITPQLLFSAGVRDQSNPALVAEIGAVGNIQDFLTQMNAASDVVASSYVASKNGFIIMADKISDRKFADPADEAPAPYEAFARPWYVKARRMQKLVFTDVVDDINGGGLCIICAAPYFAGGSFSGVVGMGSYLTEINQIVLSTQIGKTGFGFILNEKGEVTISPKTQGELTANPNEPFALRYSENEALAALAERMTAGETGVTLLTLDGQDCYLAYAPLTSVGWSFATVIEAGEVVAPALSIQESIIGLTDAAQATVNGRVTAILLMMVIAAVVLLALVALVGWGLATRLTNPINELTRGVGEMNGGNLELELNIHTGDEIESLALAFNTMTRELKAYMKNLTAVTAEKERIGAELDVATHIQASMLPCIFPAFPGRPEFDIYATMQPAKEVGGDFYDFFLVDDDHLAVVIADVSGKGVPAALFMVIAKTLIKDHTQTGAEASAVFTRVNDMLCETNEEGLFVTAWMGVLEISTGKLVYVNAGHNPPLVRRVGGTYEYLKLRPGFVLAGMEGIRYAQAQLTLAPGDSLYLYTDGVTEATDAEEALYGEDRLKRVLDAHAAATPHDLLPAVKADIDAFVGEAPQFDDITMLCLQRTERGKNG